MQITSYNIELGLKKKIALVADLHENNPSDVLVALRNINPDMIFVVGDLWERQDETYSEWNHKNMGEIQTNGRFQKYCYHATQIISSAFRDDKDMRTEEERNYSNEFLRKASLIAPIYVSVGNHEWYYTDSDYGLLKETGTILLDNEHVLINVEDKTVVLGGLSTRINYEWLQEFMAVESETKILLCHHPEYVDRYVKECGVADLIVSGHAHGGQWRLFGRYPLYAPGQGLFPKLTKGVYNTNAGTLVVSAGCGNHMKFPRVGNPCEVVELII